jgi:hypothetical protein
MTPDPRGQVLDLLDALDAALAHPTTEPGFDLVDQLRDAIARLQPGPVEDLDLDELAAWRAFGTMLRDAPIAPAESPADEPGSPEHARRELAALRDERRRLRTQALDAGRAVALQTKQVEQIERLLAAERAKVRDLEKRAKKPPRAGTASATRPGWTPGDRDRAPEAIARRPAATSIACASCRFGTAHRDALDGYMCGLRRNDCQPGIVNALYERAIDRPAPVEAREL